MTFDQATQEADFHEAYRLFVSPPSSQRKLGLLVISLALFAVVWIGRGGSSYIDLAIILGVLFVHELGHAIAMMVFGYRDVRIFFIPLLGAATSGRPRGVARWKQAIVLLAGPLPGLVAGCVLRALAEPGVVTHVAAILIVINAINLLPVEPFDGGRLFQVLVFSRNRHLELVFRGVTAAIVVGVSLYMHFWALAFFGYLLLATWSHTRRVLAAAEPLKSQGLPEDPAQLDETQQRMLYLTAWNTLPPAWQMKWRGKPAPQANVMDQLHQRAIQRPPSWAASGGVLALWVGGIALAIVTLMPLRNRTASWHVYRGPSFTVEIPDRARVIKDKPTYLSFSDDESLLGIRYQTLQNPDTDYVSEVESKLSPDAKPAGRPHEFLLPVKDHVLRMRVIAPGADRVGYILEAWPDDAIGIHFLDSFHAAPP